MGEPTNDDPLLTIKQVGDWCNASPSWARKAIRLGLLPYEDLALESDPKRSEPRVRLSALLAFLKSRERRAEPAKDAQARLGQPGEIKTRAPRRRAMRA